MFEWQKRFEEEIRQVETRLTSLKEWLSKPESDVLLEIAEYCENPVDYFFSLKMQEIAMTNYLHELQYQKSLWINV